MTGSTVSYDIATTELLEHTTGLLAEGFRLALVAGHDDSEQGTDRFRVVYLFTAPSPDRRVELTLALDRTDHQLPTIAPISFPGGRFERELHDLFGIAIENHPLPRRLVRHFHWPRGWFPMRHDAGEPPAFADPEGPYPFRTVEGSGVYEIPVGPVHAGLIEPGHFRFSVVGETILKLKPRLWFVHKGIERLFQGKHVDEGVQLAERISGDTAVGHTLAYCTGVEQALGLEVSAEQTRDRAILLELERLYNHITDIGALCNDVGFGILNAHAQNLREQLLRVNADVTGHRLLRGAIAPGSTTLAAQPDPDVLARIAADAAEIVDLALRHTVVHDRFAGTAVLNRQQAYDIGVLGYVARASGLDLDARRGHPFYQASTSVPVHTSPDGDVLARFTVRAEEFQTSVRLIAQFLDGKVEPITAAAPGPSAGVGIVEAWRGAIVHRVELTPDRILRRVKVVDPSFFNWPALPVALNDTIVPDFPLTNKSFNLSYAGNDL